MGLAFVLALGLLAVLELLWPSKGFGRHARTSGKPSAVELLEESPVVGARRGPASDEKNANSSWF
jgi:hypothetical protein